MFGVEDPKWGQVVAAALVAQGEPPEATELREQLKAILAPHKWPRLVRFVEELPITPAGKVDRAAAEAEAKRELRSI